MKRMQRARRDEGIALITTIGLLVVFMLIGIAWVDYMTVETNKSDLQINSTRARYAASGGVEAGIAQVEAALAAHALPSDTPLEFQLPVYRKGDTPALDEERACRVKVTISDESARININYAPPNVLRKILGVDGEKAREIRSSLPRLEGEPMTAGDQDRHWFTSVDELVTRSFLTAEQLTPELAAMLTVYSVPDPANPAGYMNVNTAPGPVLEALLDITPDMAASVIDKRTQRPLADVTELSAAAGKDPATFNVRPAPDALNTLPRELGFTSRCYRIASQAELVKDEKVIGSGYAEAVVYFDPQGSPRILYWSEGLRETESVTASVEEPEAAPAAA